MDVEAILQTVLASTASATVVAFLAKGIIGLWLSKDLETHRAKLASESAIQVEQLRGQLERVATEHQVRFSRAHEKRTFLIATIYSHIERIHAPLRQWHLFQQVMKDIKDVEGEQAPLSEQDKASRQRRAAELAAKARPAVAELEAFYRPRAIWLGRDLCAHIDALIDSLNILLLMLDAEARGAPMTEQGKDNSYELATNFSNVAAATRAALEDRFRAVLGIDIEEAHPSKAVAKV